jgi:hypothetical protein
MHSAQRMRCAPDGRCASQLLPLVLQALINKVLLHELCTCNVAATGHANTAVGRCSVAAIVFSLKATGFRPAERHAPLPQCARSHS